jgi:hypothetical protein
MANLNILIIERLMKKFVILLFTCFASVAYADHTGRTELFNNDKVNVWKTVIYPNKKQLLPSHRHEHDRVLIAFTDGVLKVTNDKGETHLLKLKKNQAYYLQKDLPDEMHTDENMSHHPVKVLVMEIKQ